MKPTKPDRWERMVQQITTSDINIPKQFCYSDEVPDLLRKEHAAVVKRVRDLRNYYLTSCDPVKAEACEAVLITLKRRAK